MDNPSGKTLLKKDLLFKSVAHKRVFTLQIIMGLSRDQGVWAAFVQSILAR